MIIKLIKLVYLVQKTAAAELNNLGGPECIPLNSDITIKTECEKISNEISKRENGKLDILINNSGILLGPSLTNITEIAWDQTIKLNVISVYLMTMAYVYVIF